MTAPAESLTLELDAALIAALDGWIARHEPPLPTREDAVRQVLAGALGAHGPSTMVPNMVTGRDIV